MGLVSWLARWGRPALARLRRALGILQPPPPPPPPPPLPSPPPPVTPPVEVGAPPEAPEALPTPPTHNYRTVYVAETAGEGYRNDIRIVAVTTTPLSERDVSELRSLLRYTMSVNNLKSPLDSWAYFSEEVNEPTTEEELAPRVEATFRRGSRVIEYSGKAGEPWSRV